MAPRAPRGLIFMLGCNRQGAYLLDAVERMPKSPRMKSGDLRLFCSNTALAEVSGGR